MWRESHPCQPRLFPWFDTSVCVSSLSSKICLSTVSHPSIRTVGHSLCFAMLGTRPGADASLRSGKRLVLAVQYCSYMHYIFVFRFHAPTEISLVTRLRL